MKIAGSLLEQGVFWGVVRVFGEWWDVRGVWVGMRRRKRKREVGG